MKKRIVIIAFGNRQAGSTKFRIVQYEHFFHRMNYELDYIFQDDLNSETIHKLAKADVVINQKCLLNGSLSRKVFSHNPKLIFDFDDSIYTRPGRPYNWLTQWRTNYRLRNWLEKAQIVTTANEYLAQFARKYSQNVHVIPMALDLQTWKSQSKKQSPTIIIGWAGAPANLHHIERLDPLLNSILTQYPHVRLAIYSGKCPQLTCPFDFTPFQDGTEPHFTSQLDIGLLPLSDEEFSRGKSPIKAIQYLAAGIPVIGNVYGATAEILNIANSIAVESSQEWIWALKKLIENPELRQQLGQAGRKHAEQHHDIQKTQQSFLQLINSL